MFAMMIITCLYRKSADFHLLKKYKIFCKLKNKRKISANFNIILTKIGDIAIFRTVLNLYLCTL